MLLASKAVIVTVNALPAVAVPGALTAKCVAWAAATTLMDAVPVMVLVTVSVALIVCGPVVCSVAPFAKVCAPLSPAVKL